MPGLTEQLRRSVANPLTTADVDLAAILDDVLAPRASTSPTPAGRRAPPLDDGSIERVDLDGRNRTTIVPPGGTFTPKQLHLAGRTLYWGDREGMRVMRCDLDGGGVETLVRTGRGDDDRRDQTRWCVGVAVDPDRRHLY